MNSTEVHKLIDKALKKSAFKDGVTTREISEILGIGPEATRVKMRQLIKAGRLKNIGDGLRSNIAGRNTTVPLYIFIKCIVAIFFLTNCNTAIDESNENWEYIQWVLSLPYGPPIHVYNAKDIPKYYKQ